MNKVRNFIFRIDQWKNESGFEFHYRYNTMINWQKQYHVKHLNDISNFNLI